MFGSALKQLHRTVTRKFQPLKAFKTPFSNHISSFSVFAKSSFPTTCGNSFGSLRCSNDTIFVEQKRFKGFGCSAYHKYNKLSNNQGAKARFLFMRDGTILRGPIGFRKLRIKMSRAQRDRKKNKLFPLVGKFNRRAKRLVPYWKKPYMRKWERKSLSFWYREQWGSRPEPEIKHPAFERYTGLPHREVTKLDPASKWRNI